MIIYHENLKYDVCELIINKFDELTKSEPSKLINKGLNRPTEPVADLETNPLVDETPTNQTKHQPTTPTGHYYVM